MTNADVSPGSGAGVPPAPSAWLEAYLASVGRLLLVAEELHYHGTVMAEHFGLDGPEAAPASILAPERRGDFAALVRQLTTGEPMRRLRQIDPEAAPPHRQRRALILGRRAYHRAFRWMVVGARQVAADAPARHERGRRLAQEARHLVEAERLIAFHARRVLGKPPPSRAVYRSFPERTRRWVSEPLRAVGAPPVP